MTTAITGCKAKILIARIANSGMITNIASSALSNCRGRRNKPAMSLRLARIPKLTTVRKMLIWMPIPSIAAAFMGFWRCREVEAK